MRPRGRKWMSFWRRGRPQRTVESARLRSMQIRVDTESWDYKVPFRVSRGAESALDVLVVTLTDSQGHAGRGEAAGVDYDGETVPLLCAQLDAVRPAIERGTVLDFSFLATLLPP